MEMSIQTAGGDLAISAIDRSAHCSVSFCFYWETKRGKESEKYESIKIKLEALFE